MTPSAALLRSACPCLASQAIAVTLHATPQRIHTAQMPAAASVACASCTSRQALLLLTARPCLSCGLSSCMHGTHAIPH